MTYIDGYLIPVPADKREDYRAMAAFAAPALGQTSLTTVQHTVLDSVIVASW